MKEQFAIHSIRPRNIQLQAALLTGLIACLFFSVGGVLSASQNMVPFECDGTVYYSLDPTTSSTYLATYNSETRLFEQIGDVTWRYNGIGYNPLDNFIYATRNRSGEIYRIDATGRIEPLGLASDHIFTGQGWVSSTFTPDGLMVVAQGLTQGGALLVIEGAHEDNPRVISSAKLSVNVVDIVYNPSDGLIYTFDSTNLQSVILDPYTGEMTPLGYQHDEANRPGASGMAFDADGRLLSIGGHYDEAIDNLTLYSLDIDPNSSTYGRYSIHEVTQQPLANGADATSCYF